MIEYLILGELIVLLLIQLMSRDPEEVRDMGYNTRLVPAVLGPAFFIVLWLPILIWTLLQMLEDRPDDT